MTQDLIYPGETCAVEKTVYLLILYGMSHKYQLSPSVLMCHLRLAFLYKFSV